MDAFSSQYILPTLVVLILTCIACYCCFKNKSVLVKTDAREDQDFSKKKGKGESDTKLDAS